MRFISPLTWFNQTIDRLTGMNKLPSQLRRQIRGAQVRLFYTHMRLMTLGFPPVAGFYLYLMKDTPVFPIIAFCFMFMAGMLIYSWQQSRQLFISQHVEGTYRAGSRVLRIVYFQVITASLLWAAVAYLSAKYTAGFENTYVLGLFTAASLVVTAYSYSSILQSALIYTVITGAAIAYIGTQLLSGFPLIALFGIVVAYVTALPSMFARMMRGFVKHYSNDLRNRENAERISRTLADYQDSARESFWECDALGRLVSGSPDFLYDIGLQRLEIADDKTFSERLRQLNEENAVAADRLADAMRAGKAVHQVEFNITRGGRVKWYQMNGKPVLSNSGKTVGFIGVASDVTAERDSENRMSDMARTDPLTKLLNRSSFNEALDDAVRQLERFGTPMTLIFMDLDKFKLVNDTYGHHAGDELLKEVAVRVRKQLRDTDIVARLGGDEFAVILRETKDPVLIAKLSTRLIESLAEPFHVAGETLFIGSSVGIALAPIHGTRPEQLLRNADLALYRAKEDGRGVFRFFEAQMDFAQRERRILEQEMRDALADESFDMNFQPMIGVKTGRVECMEGLIRWDHPIRGMISPEEFIPIAEQSNLISEIGKWTLKKALCTAMDWPEHISVAVNVSATHFMRSDVVADLRAALEESGIDPRRVEVEITESLLVEDTDDVARKLRAIKALGVSIAMDDFGTGYSSLSYLTKFPFDRLKIDKSFLKDLDENRNVKAILYAISTLGENLGINITVEGVERPQQIEFLRTIWCDQLQGYFYSRPLKIEDIGAFLLKDFSQANANEHKEMQAELIVNG